MKKYLFNIAIIVIGLIVIGVILFAWMSDTYRIGKKYVQESDITTIAGKGDSLTSPSKATTDLSLWKDESHTYTICDPNKENSCIEVGGDKIQIREPAEATTNLSFQVHAKSIFVIPYDKECEKKLHEKYGNSWWTNDCLDYMNTKLGSRFDKETPWNVQCEDGYIWDFRIIAPTGDIGGMGKIQIWCEGKQ